MSAKKEAFKTISAHLMDTIGVANLGDEGTVESPSGVMIPKLRWVDKNRGQVQHLTREMGIPLPAVLIGFPEIDYESLGAGIKRGMGVIRIISLFESFADSFQGSINQDKALEYFEFNDLLFSTLENFSGAAFSKLTRIREEEDEDHDFLIITTTDYLTELYETAKAEPVEFLDGNPTVVKGEPHTNNPTNESGQFVID